MTKIAKLVKRVGKLLARTEAGIAQAHAVGEALIERADAVEKVRMKDLDRQRKMLDAETDPYKLRGIEQQYLATLGDRDRARRVGRYERDLRAARKEREAQEGGPLIRP